MKLTEDPIMWTCMVCGDEREDRFISVQHRPVKGLEGAFPATRVNVRFCNDRKACQEGAWATGRFMAADPVTETV